MELKISLEITALNPLAIATGHATSGLVDSFIIKDTRGLPYIPGTTLKGRLKYYIQQFARDEDLERLFGKGGNTPGQLIFTDAKLQQPQAAIEIRSTIQVDRFRKVVVDKALGFSEAARIDLPLYGEIRGFLNNDTAKRDVALIYLGLKALTYIGGGKSKGLGRVRASGNFVLDGREISESTIKEWVREIV